MLSQLFKMFPKRFVPKITLKSLAAIHWFCIGIHLIFDLENIHYFPSFSGATISLFSFTSCRHLETQAGGGELPHEKAKDVSENLNLTPKGD